MSLMFASCQNQSWQPRKIKSIPPPRWVTRFAQLPQFGTSSGNVLHSVSRGTASMSPSSASPSTSRYGLMGAFSDFDPLNGRYQRTFSSPGPKSRGLMDATEGRSFPNRLYPGGRYVERVTRVNIPRRSFRPMPVINEVSLESRPSFVKFNKTWSSAKIDISKVRSGSGLPNVANRAAASTVWSSLGRGLTSLRSIAARAGARVLASMGPTGWMIAAAVGAAVVIGGVVYWVVNRSGKKELVQGPPLQTISEEPVDVSQPIVPDRQETAQPVDDWSGNIPWEPSPRPFHVSIQKIFNTSSVLRQHFGFVV